MRIIPKNKFKKAINAWIEGLNREGNLKGLGNLGDAARTELASFLMYLSASDGKIRRSEAKVISDYFSLKMTPKQINEFIREHHVYSKTFESNVPLSMIVLVRMDNEMISVYHQAPEDYDSFSEHYLDVYKQAGQDLIVADGDKDVNELRDFDIYIQMLEDYLNENLLSRKASGKYNKSARSGTAY